MFTSISFAVPPGRGSHSVIKFSDTEWVFDLKLEGGARIETYHSYENLTNRERRERIGYASGGSATIASQ